MTYTILCKPCSTIVFLEFQLPFAILNWYCVLQGRNKSNPVFPCSCLSCLLDIFDRLIRRCNLKFNKQYEYICRGEVT